MTSDNRTNEPSHNRITIQDFRDGKVSVIHEDQVRAIACTLDELKRAVAAYEARAALVAAQGAASQAVGERGDLYTCVDLGHEDCDGSHRDHRAPVLPSSTVDEDALAEVLRSYLPMGEDPALNATAKAQARAVAQWLKGQGR